MVSMTFRDPFRFEFSDDGTLRMCGDDGWREAVCAGCGEPIRWVLDMFSFSTGDFRLMHAHCAWMPDGFDLPKQLARDRMVRERS